AADDRLVHLRAVLHVGGVDHRVGPEPHHEALHPVGVAHVERDRPAVRRLAAEAAGQHLEAPLLGEPADLAAEIARAAGDEELHASSTIVTGPSFTSSTSIAAPKTPRSTGTPSSASTAQNRS